MGVRMEGYVISLDCETTGVDFAHGAMPFLVTTCDSEGMIRWFEWDVDPLTRTPDIPNSDIADITELIDAADLIYLQNSKFDARALATIGIDLPWPKVRDTLIMGHLLASNHRHDLTWMCVEYLGVDIELHEKHVKEVTQACRAIAKRGYPHWKLADEGVPETPSVKASSKRDEDKPWKNDMWIERALLKQWQEDDTPLDHKLASDKWAGDACSRYANSDSEHTLPLGLEMERLIRDRRLWAIYEHRLHLPRVYCEMECYGITAIGEYTEATIRDYEEYTAEAESTLVTIAAEHGHDLQLADGAALNDNMRDFFYGAVTQSCPRCNYTKRVKYWNGERLEASMCPKCAKSTNRCAGMHHQLVTTRRDNLALPIITSEKTGNASLDKDAMLQYLTTLNNGPALDFIRVLTNKRKHDTSLTYMRAYRRFWVPVSGAIGYYRIHPFINPCGTDHLRASSNSPNLQNVGKQEQRCDECDGEGCSLCGGIGLVMLSARNCFGPAPDREWWSLDFESIEKRIPAYECMEPALVEIFEKPNEPPYWGSDHNLIASLLWPHLYEPIAHKKGKFKERYINEYKRAKNTNFAKQYGAGKKKVDATAQVSGAFNLIDRGMPLLANLQRQYLSMAEKTGFVETLPDRRVDPTRGYPILASRMEDGRVLSTTPFNYHTSGTACWCKNTALIRCADKCAEWRSEGFDAHVSLEIHDELIFDFPRGRTPEENLPRALTLKMLMEQSGEDLIPRIPTPVSLSYHTESWAKETPIDGYHLIG